MAGDDTKGMSERGWSNVAGIMPQISAAVKERQRRGSPNIDLATAENWLLRPELIELCKDAIYQKLDAKVHAKRILASWEADLSRDPLSIYPIPAALVVTPTSLMHLLASSTPTSVRMFRSTHHIWQLLQERQVA